MPEISTDQLIAVWDAPNSSIREVNFYKAAGINWLDLLFNYIFNESFISRFLNNQHEDRVIPVTIEMLQHQNREGKDYWYIASKEIIDIQTSELGVNSKLRAEALSKTAITKLNFIRRLSIRDMPLPQKAEVGRDFEYIKTLRQQLDLLNAAKASGSGVWIDDLKQKIREFESEITSNEAYLFTKSQGKSPSLKGDKQFNDKGYKSDSVLSLNNTPNQHEQTTKKLVSENTKTAVNSNPLRIIHSSSRGITRMQGGTVIRHAYTGDGNNAAYFTRCETTLHFYKWYSSTRCKLSCNGISTWLQNIRWNGNESNFSGEEIAIISRVFLLEKIKLVRRSLKKALDDHHGA